LDGLPTRIGHGDGRRVRVAEAMAQPRDDGHAQRADGADDDGPEEGGALARGPAAVADGVCPEAGRCGRHFGGLW